MADDFDLNTYLDTKLKGVDIEKKMANLRYTSETKSARLTEAADKIAAQERTWVGKTGHFNTEDFIGARINDAASVVSGTSRLAGHIVSLVPNSLAMLQDTMANENDVAAIDYIRQGKATSEEMRRADILKGAQSLRDSGRNVNNFFDLTGIVDQTNRNKLNADLGAEFESNWGKVTSGWKNGRPSEMVSGLASLIATAGEAAITNPSAAREYILENAPQLFVGAAGKVGQIAMGASNVGYAADEYQKGIDNYRAAHGGSLPPEAERNRMAIMAASLAIAEHAGDKALLGMAKAKKALGGAAATSEDVATQGFKAAMANTAKAGVGGFVTEAATEGYQTYAEGEVEGKPASAKDIYTGAVIGGIAGSGLSAGARAVGEVLGVTPEKVEARQQEAVKQVEDVKAVQQAVAEQNPDVFLDRKSKDYSPAKAIGVMMELAGKEDTTEEQFKEHLAKAGDVVTRLEAQRDMYDAKAIASNINDIESELKAADPADTETIADLNDELDGLKSTLTELNDPKKKLGYENQYKTVSNQLKEAEATYAGFTRMAFSTPAANEVTDHIESANSSDNLAATKSGEALINLSMVSPDELPADSARKLAENDKNGLDEDQRTYLREFSEARVAENMLKDQSAVSKEVLYGSPEGSDIKMVGISEYRTRIGTAIAANNEQRATRQLKGLRDFAVDHSAKQAIVEQAFAMATDKANPVASQIIKQGNEWVFNTGKRLSDAALKKNGGVNIHKNSGKIVSEIINEARALNLAHNQLGKAVGLRFKTAAVQSLPSTPVPAVAPVSPASLSREKREREGRVNSDKSELTPKTPETVAEKPQPVKKNVLTGIERQAKIDAILAAAAANPNKGKANPEQRKADADKRKVDVAPSPAATPAASVAVAPSLQVAAAPAETVKEEVVSNNETTVATQSTPQPETAEQKTEAPAEVAPAEAVTAEAQSTTPVGEHGRMSVMAGFVKEATQTVAEMFADKVFNPVAQFVTQKGTHESYKTHRPLVRIKDFISKMGDGTVDNFVGLLDSEPNDAQIAAIEDFRQKATQWAKIVTDQIGNPLEGEGNFDFRFRDMMQYLITREGDAVKVDENLLTAVAYGGYHWAVDTASAPRMTTEKINAMFGRDEDQTVQYGIWDHIHGMHGHEDVTINDLGDVIVQSLGFTLRADAPQDILPRIKTALGAHALLMLETAGVLERRAILRDDIVGYLEPVAGDVKNKNAELMFVFPNYEKLEAFREVNKNTGNVVDKLMAADAGPVFAKTAPTKFHQEFAQHTRQEISKTQRKAMERLHNTPHKVIPEMFMALQGMGIDAILRIGGFRDLENDHVHYVNQRSVEAQNRNVTQQIDLMLEMMGVTDINAVTEEDLAKLAGTEYFVEGEVWKNFRAGIVTRSLNQQTSKFHRYMFARPNWTVTIDMNKPEQRLDLEVAIAAGLGIKTDEQSNEETAELLREMFHSDAKLQTAVDSVYQGITTGKWENIDVIVEVSLKAEGMMTLQTLVAYAKYLNADASGKLEVTMLVGADGKTNGPILTHLALGAAGSVDGLLDMMERGGMYAKGDGKPTHYSESRKNGLEDLYEDLASEVLSRIDDSAEMDALQVITGKLSKNGAVAKAGRNLVKTPLTAFAFGSSLKGSILAMENKFIADLYGQMEKLARQKAEAGTDEKKLAEAHDAKVTFIRATNTLLKMANPALEQTQEDISMDALMSQEMDKKDEAAYRMAFNQLMAAPVKAAMESYFAVFIQRRSDLNTTIGAAYAIYREAYASAKTALVAKLIEEGKMAYRIQTGGDEKSGKGQKLPLHGLTVEQERELRASIKDLLPVAHTAYSVGGDIDGGIYMAKTDAVMSKDALHFTQINVNRPVKQAGTKGNGKTLKTYTMVREETEPGVAGTPYFIHSLDSANMHMALLDIDQSLNVHDEIGNNPLDIKKAAGAINRATVLNMLKFSPAREALHMLERMVIGMQKGIETGQVSQQAVANLIASWQDTMHKRLKAMVPYEERGSVKRPGPYTAAKLMFGMALDNANQADKLRLQTIAQMGYVDQYVWEGGQFEVTPSIRDEAAQKLKDLNKKMDPEAGKAMEAIFTFLKHGTVTPVSTPVEAEIEMPVADKPIGGAAVAAVMGESMTQQIINELPAAERAEAIQTITRAEAAMPGSGMTPFGLLGVPTKLDVKMRDAFHAKPVMNRAEVVATLAASLAPMFRSILSATAKSLPDNLKVVMVTADSDPVMYQQATLENSRGWFVPTKGGDNTIYLLSDEFVHSGLNPETLLHELVHAATARELVNPSSKAAKSLIADLNALIVHLKQQEGVDRFGHILNGENALHEIVAWGMSNNEFQKWMAKIPFKSKTTTNRLTTAFKEFVRILTGGRYSGSALEALLRNTAGIYASAVDNQSKIESNLSQLDAPQSYTTGEIFEGLASEVRPLAEHDAARLRSLISSMVEKLAPIYGAFGKDVQSKTLSEQSVFAAVQAGGQAPFASNSIAHGLGYNEQVAFMLEQVEVTIRTAISGDTAQVSLAYKELSKLFDEAAEQLKGKLSDADYDFIFKIETGKDNRSDYLSRFAALGLVHPDIHALLNFPTKTVPRQDSSMLMMDRLTAVFRQILEWFAGKWTNTQSGQHADSKLDALATQLVLIESKRRARLNVARSKTAENIEETFRGMAEKARDKVDDFVSSDMFKNSGSNMVKAVGSVTSLAVKDRLDWLFLSFQTFTDTHFKGNETTIAGVLNELQGSKKDNVVFYKLLRMTKFMEGRRKDLISNTTKVVLKSFANQGKDLTDAGKKAISAVMLRTDMSALLDQFGLDGLLAMMKSKATLAKAIVSMEQQLAGNPHQLFYLNAAEAMGYQMATGDAGVDHTLLNAYAIARLHGTDQRNNVTEEQAAAVQDIIDKLGSLYALNEMGSSLSMGEAIKVFEAEQARTDGGNGVEMVLRVHQKLQQDSKEKLFKEQQALMTKGYTPEIYNHYIEVTTANKSEQEQMEKLGYGKGMVLGKDQHDPETQGDKLLFARHGSGLLPYLSGALSTTAMKTKGERKHNGNVDFFSDQGQFNNDMMRIIEQNKRAAIKEMFKRRVHPGTTNNSFMVPVLNPMGEVVNYRYMMKNRTKDEVLFRDNRFEHLLGAMAGSIYDKQEAPKQNKVIVEALKAQYDLEFKARAVSYVEVGPRSPDPANRERYRLLPEATKQHIRDTWNSDSMFVRKDLLDINFGYRKKSFSDALQQDPEARVGFAKFTAEFLGLIGGRKSAFEDDDGRKNREARATLRIRNAEEIWQTFVREAKDMIVVKSGSTLMGNVMSNFTLLYAYGVPLTDMMRSHRIALRGALDYQKNSEELFELQSKLDTGTASDVDATKRRVVQLKDALSRNPVRQLIEAGLMPTIVEDVEVDDDIYSYKSRFVKKLNEKVAKLNPHVVSLGKVLYMTHDTKLYKGLSQASQLSDFLARYTLYQHMTTKKRDPMPVEKAIQLASDAFINYDVPTHRNVQFANDMGMIRFTKYYLRIQKVIMHLYRDNPGRMLALMAFDQYFSTVPTVLDSAVLKRIGNNPLNWGALEYAFSFDDLLSSKAILAPF